MFIMEIDSAMDLPSRFLGNFLQLRYVRAMDPRSLRHLRNDCVVEVI